MYRMQLTGLSEQTSWQVSYASIPPTAFGFVLVSCLTSVPLGSFPRMPLLGILGSPRTLQLRMDFLRCCLRGSCTCWSNDEPGLKRDTVSTARSSLQLAPTSILKRLVPLPLHCKKVET